MIALQSTRKVIPGRADEGILAREILDQGFMSRLHMVISFTIASKCNWAERHKIGEGQEIKENIYILDE